MATFEFHQQADFITDRLVMAIGWVTLAWAPIDDAATRMCRAFLVPADTQFPLEQRINDLRVLAAEIYAAEPDERLKFDWFLTRIARAAADRNRIAHGSPGRIRLDGGDWVEGLMVPHPRRIAEHVPMTVDHIERLHDTLKSLHGESFAVSHAFVMAVNTFRGRVVKEHTPDGGFVPLTMAERQPLMPCWVPVPADYIVKKAKPRKQPPPPSKGP